MAVNSFMKYRERCEVYYKARKEHYCVGGFFAVPSVFFLLRCNYLNKQWRRYIYIEITSSSISATCVPISCMTVLTKKKKKENTTQHQTNQPTKKFLAVLLIIGDFVCNSFLKTEYCSQRLQI